MYKHTFYYFLGNKKYPEIYILQEKSVLIFLWQGFPLLVKVLRFWFSWPVTLPQIALLVFDIFQIHSRHIICLKTTSWWWIQAYLFCWLYEEEGGWRTNRSRCHYLQSMAREEQYLRLCGEIVTTNNNRNRRWHDTIQHHTYDWAQ